MSEVQSPVFRIDLTDSATVGRLREQLQYEETSFNNGAQYRAPEVLLERRDSYSPGLIKALLESGEIVVWDYQKQHPDYPRIGRGFGVACQLIGDIPGVVVIVPSAA